jgi:hypothetical protein
MDEAKLRAWYEGWSQNQEIPEVFDSDLTMEEVRWLEKRVAEAVVDLTLNTRKGAITSAPARMLQ